MNIRQKRKKFKKRYGYNPKERFVWELVIERKPEEVQQETTKQQKAKDALYTVIIALAKKRKESRRRK